MLSEEIRNYSHRLWLQTKPNLGGLQNEIQAELEALSGDTAILAELACATLPVSDLGSVDFEVIKSYARHGAFLRSESPFCKDIPEDIFLHNVFFPRINSEDLVDCRPFFFNKLWDKVKNLSLYEAALEVNRWCAQNMSYESTDDRTINPITAYNCALGRCGEESTFAVTALRSVGIAARQIYVPWWSHCDDNHAWLEVYTGDGWHFLGACEIETELDRGWFVNASSRAMIVCCRNFFDYVGEGLKDEALIQKKGICLAYNQTSRYAETSKTLIKVLDSKGEAAAGARLSFYVENMAGLREIAALSTDSFGRAQIETGRGSMLIEAEYRGKFSFLKYTVRENREIEISVSETEPRCGESIWDFEAPAASHKFSTRLSPEEQQLKAELIAEAGEKRRDRLASYELPEYKNYPEKMQKVFRIAAGHGEEIRSFYDKYAAEAQNLLMNLKEKDWRDADTEVLADHIEASRVYKDDENFLNYIQNPRIGYEKLSSWRQDVEKYLSSGQKQSFRAEPEKLWLWINENFKEGSCRFHPVLWLQPGAALKLKAGDEKGRRLLFVAVLRTLGRAARLNPVDNRAEFWNGTEFEAVESKESVEKTAVLSLNVERNMKVNQNLGLARWDRGWRELDLSGENLKNLKLPQGKYCLHCVNRLPGGNQLISHRVFELSADTSMNVENRKAELKQLLSDFRVELPVENSGLELQLYPEPGAEPSEHSLNELLASKGRLEKLNAMGMSLRIILKNKKAGEQESCKKAVSELKNLKLSYLDFESGGLEALARAVYLEPGLYPFMILSDGKKSYYASAGYSVGAVDLALQLAELKLK